MRHDRTTRPQTESDTKRAGRVNALWALVVSGIAVIAAAAGLLSIGGPGQAPQGETLTMYCAAGIRVPVEEVAEEYEKKYGVHVELQFAGSNTLLNQLQVNKFDTGDLYLAADDFYTDKAKELGLASETLSIAYMRPVIAVRTGNEVGIESIQDLLKDDIRVSLGSPDDAAIGRAVRKRLKPIKSGESDLWAQLEAHVTDIGVFKTTVNDVANDVKVGTADAAIVWDSTVAMPKYRDDLMAIPVEELDGDPNLISICVLSSSEQPTAALRFARFLTARDRGLPVFEKYGMRPIDGDVWVENPEITFYCGAVNQQAVAGIVEDFEIREGVRVQTIYNGCGFLTGQMKLIRNRESSKQFPDVYMACDRYYLENVRDWFQDDVDVSEVEIVLAVPKGSDRVRSVSDLLKPGVRVAIGEPEQCTIGALTRRLLTREGIYEKLKAKQRQNGEVVVEKPSSAMLIPDVTTGTVDVALAYYSDTVSERSKVDVLHIESPLNLAVQPFSVSRSSLHKHLARRLFERVAAAEEEFESAGFHFRLKEPALPREVPIRD